MVFIFIFKLTWYHSGIYQQGCKAAIVDIEVIALVVWEGFGFFNSLRVVHTFHN